MINMMHFLAPAVAADDVDQQFSNGMAQVIGGVWSIIEPYVAIGIVLFALVVAARKFAGRRR